MGRKQRSGGGYNPPSNPVAEASLSKPINVMGEEVDTLYFREATFGDVSGIKLATLDEDLDGDTLVLLTSRLANIPAPSAKRIPLGDLGEVGEAIGVALAPFEDSETSSEETEP